MWRNDMARPDQRRDKRLLRLRLAQSKHLAFHLRCHDIPRLTYAAMVTMWDTVVVMTRPRITTSALFTPTMLHIMLSLHHFAFQVNFADKAGRPQTNK